MRRYDDFVVEATTKHPAGLKLDDIVRLAVLQGFRGNARSSLTKSICRSLKKLIKKGAITRDDDDGMKIIKTA